MSRCACTNPKPPHARLCVVCRAGTVKSRPGVKHMTDRQKIALRRVLKARAA
jgi:hypothetical protein